MRIKYRFFALFVSVIAFSGAYILICQNSPAILRAYCQKQVDNNIEISVDSCIEAHKGLFIFSPTNQ